MQCFGIAVVLNGVFAAVGLVIGEADATFLIGILAVTVLAEVIRKSCGYETLKVARYSFFPFAYSFNCYAVHWRTDMEDP